MDRSTLNAIAARGLRLTHVLALQALGDGWMPTRVATLWLE